MKLRLNIKDSKAAAFIELLKSFDFVDIELEEDMETTPLSDTIKTNLDQQLSSYKNNPNTLLNWKDLKKELSD